MSRTSPAPADFRIEIHGRTRPPVLSATDRSRWGPLVRRLAIRIASRGDVAADVQELCREGFVAVGQALRDATSIAPDQPLEGYVEHRIRGAMLEALHLASAAAREERLASRAIARAMRLLAERSGLPPTEEEIAAALSLSQADYEALLLRIAAAGVARLEPLVAGGDPPSADLAEAITALPPQERDLLTLVYLAELSIVDAAGAIGATPRGTQVLLAQALHRLRASIGKE